MADKFSGSGARGWNDPPMLQSSINGQNSNSSQPKKQLTQRVTHILPENRPTPPRTGDAKPPTEQIPLSAPRPTISENLPPPPPPECTLPKEMPQGKAATTGTSAVIQEELLPTLEEVLSKLCSTLEECHGKLKARVLEDVKRKLNIFEKCWMHDKLSNPVKIEMGKLATAITERNYDEANRLHLGLMMDHISEVSSWMVGIKRLIQEAKGILPEETDKNGQSMDTEQETPSLLIPVTS